MTILRILVKPLLLLLPLIPWLPFPRFLMELQRWATSNVVMVSVKLIIKIHDLWYNHVLSPLYTYNTLCLSLSLCLSVHPLVLFYYALD